VAGSLALENVALDALSSTAGEEGDAGFMVISVYDLFRPISICVEIQARVAEGSVLVLGDDLYLYVGLVLRIS